MDNVIVSSLAGLGIDPGNTGIDTSALTAPAGIAFQDMTASQQAAFEAGAGGLDFKNMTADQQAAWLAANTSGSTGNSPAGLPTVAGMSPWLILAFVLGGLALVGGGGGGHRR